MFFFSDIYKMEDLQACINWNYMQKKDVIEILEEFKNYMEWNDGEQILDIGCGIGDVTTSVIYPILPIHSVLVNRVSFLDPYFFFRIIT